MWSSSSPLFLRSLTPVVSRICRHSLSPATPVHSFIVPKTAIPPKYFTSFERSSPKIATTMAPHPFTRQPMSIVLNSKEQQLCQLLIETTAYIKKTYPDLKPVQCRIAGGWVRDKLLGLDCDDVDVALDTMMGFDFAKYVNEYLSTTKSAISDEKTMRHENHHGRHVAKISSNPSKSKHLETATAKFFGMHIDFVNLRSETYNADSRIPTDVEFGTPEQDALRRDCTINALFYNIHTNAVEDYTKHGLSDLSNHVVRTPLPAFQTFDDDPLRILRVVRFASRFGFRLVDEICNSVGDPKIQGALISKISKERIGTELNKMLKGKNPNHAISLIDNLGIYRATFLIPPEIRLYNDNMCELGGSEINIHDKASQATATIKWLLSNLPSRFTHLSALLSSPLFSHPSSSLRLLYLCAALSPYRHYKYQAKPNRPDTITVSSHLIVKNSLKLSTQDADMSTKILSDLSALQTTLSALFSSSMSKDHPEYRLQLGNLIRSLALPKNIIGSLYPITIVLNLTLLLAPLFKYTVSDKLECIVQEEDLPSWDDNNHEVIEILKLHDELWGDIRNLKLEQIWNLNSLLSGSKVQSLLALSPGPEIKTVLDKVIEYQIMYPEQQEAEALENWVVKEFKDKIDIAAKRGSDEESEPGKVKGKKRRKR